jgi:MraZ protein
MDYTRNAGLTGVSFIKGYLEHMFLGQYRHTIDNKGRLTIPARYRELLVEGAYVIQGFDQNLMVLTPSAFDSVSRRVSQMSMTDPTARQLKRLLFSTGDKVEVDRSGRILIQQFLREVAGLDSEAIVVGVGDYFEIWAPEVWEQQATLIKDVDANAQRFVAFDLFAG